MVVEKFQNIEGSNPYGNQNKILWHMDRLSEYYKTGTTFPFQLELNATNFCNMNCKWCITKEAHRNEQIDIDTLMIFLKEFRTMGGLSIDWTGGGEPTTYRNFEQAVSGAKNIGLKQGLMTNGFFNKSLIPIISSSFDWVRISLDCVDSKDYAAMKQTKETTLNAVLKNIETLSSIEKRPRVVANINLAEWNFPHIQNTIETVKELGADGIQIRPILPQIGEKYSNSELSFYESVIPKLNDFKTFESNNFQVIISWDKFDDITSGKIYERDYTKCDFHNFVVALNANGDLCVCTHHLYDDKFTFGNIYKSSLYQIWFDGKRKDVLKYCSKLNFNKCQMCCKLHEGNKFLHFMNNPNPMSDPDFI